MRCETCQGTGLVRSLSSYPLIDPCPDCTGGVAHCCDGLVEQGTAHSSAPEKDPGETISGHITTVGGRIVAVHSSGNAP